LRIGPSKFSDRRWCAGETEARNSLRVRDSTVSYLAKNVSQSSKKETMAALKRFRAGHRPNLPARSDAIHARGTCSRKNRHHPLADCEWLEWRRLLRQLLVQDEDSWRRNGGSGIQVRESPAGLRYVTASHTRRIPTHPYVLAERLFLRHPMWNTTWRVSRFKSFAPPVAFRGLTAQNHRLRRPSPFLLKRRRSSSGHALLARSST
jgi:hypothetical protein